MGGLREVGSWRWGNLTPSALSAGREEEGVRLRHFIERREAGRRQGHRALFPYLVRGHAAARDAGVV